VYRIGADEEWSQVYQAASKFFSLHHGYCVAQEQAEPVEEGQERWRSGKRKGEG
jgi:hypothetical protein